MSKLTAADILAAKGKRQLTRVLVDNYDTAKACEEAGIDMLSVRAAYLKQVRAGAPNTFITAACPNGTYNVSNEEAIRLAFSMIDEGADSVYMNATMDRIKAVADQGIPVEGHVGFVPAHITWIGGYRAVGKTADEAMKVYRHTLALQEAGALTVEMEVVPHRIAAEIAKRVKICVVSLGSGGGCDCTYLFSYDLLGTNSGHVPRHAKSYRHHFEDSIEAFKEFKADVMQGAFPAKGNMAEIKTDEFEKFLEQVDRK